MKSIPTVGFPVSSKISNINLFIIDVFPTDWSPKKHILYFYELGTEFILDYDES
jgi:hypothetical protein